MDINAENPYIAPPTALKKLRAARSFSNTVYIYGATGYGKTELVKHYLASRRYTYISCEEEWHIDDFPEQPERWKPNNTRSIVVVDDLQLLRDEEKKQAVRKLFEREDIWLILVSRSPVPPWLIPVYVRLGFTVIGEEEFRLGETEIARLFACYDAQVDQEQLHWIAETSGGNGHILAISAKMIASGTRPGSELERAVSDLFVNYLENGLFVQWPTELVEFLMQVSVVDTFTIPMAEMVTGNVHAKRLLEMADYTGNFLTEKDGVYCLRPILLKALRHRAEIVYGKEQLREYAYNAGLYYEMHIQIPQAVEMYEKSERTSRIRELLIRNARCNPGNGHYFELRKYYLGLPKEEVEKSAILMAAMSMLYSLMMQPEESEYWYEKLKDYENTAKGGQKKEARSRLCYLDIALPHRGSKGMLHIMKQIPTLLFDKGMTLPEFSVTSNLPSTMNGGKDFCHWSRYDRELAASVGKLVQRILGRYGKGLVNAALGESLYEKGVDTFEVLTCLTCAEMEAMSGGMAEMAFAAVGIRARLHLLNGDLETAKLKIASFKEQVCEMAAVQLLPNIEALQCRMALYEGDKETVSRWMETAPDENKEFCCLERYRYLTRVRCYLALGNYMEALDLLEKMRYYAERYQRTYIHMEVEMLTAIVRQRMGEEWKKEFVDMLREACGYRFIRLISEEGPAVIELLWQVKKDVLEDDAIDREWFERLLKEAGDMAVRYPVYLKGQLSAVPDFSENAIVILRLQAKGLTVREIAEQLGMKTETVRYHTKENYRKLGVTGKTDAVLAARSLKLL